MNALKKLTGMAVLLLLLQACVIEDESGVPVSNSEYTPILMERSALASSVSYQANQDLQNPGKFYLYGNFLFINEKYKGVHIIDNTTPETPINIGFVKIPGCLDIAVRAGVLYADNAVDLVAIDVTKFPDIVVKSRVPDVFPEPSPPDGLTVPSEFSLGNRPDNTVIVEWIKNPKDE